jgi:hypothetical protein
LNLTQVVQRPRKRTGRNRFTDNVAQMRKTSVVIERRGEPVAELRAISAPPGMPAGKKARIFRSMRKVWARMPQVGDSTKIIDEDRSE